jgi:hypothetical protein
MRLISELPPDRDVVSGLFRKNFVRRDTMAYQPPLAGVRVHLSGAVPDESSAAQREGIQLFATQLAAAVFREGGTLIHGSHPSMQESLEAAAKQFVERGGQSDALTLVRAQKYAVTPDQQAAIEAERRYAAVHIIPALASDSTRSTSLVPMREWMADRCDVIVAVGGKNYDIAKGLAGVPDELEEALRQSKPGFLVAGFGGAIAGYIHDTILSSLD